MKELKYRKDNKKLLLGASLVFMGLLIFNLIINVMNTKNVFLMYILFGCVLASIIMYTFFYVIIIHKNKEKLALEDNYLAFYVSYNKNNKKLKISMLSIDILSLLGLAGISIYYMNKMDFVHVYDIYPLIPISLIALINVAIIIKDITKLNSLDRLDFYNNSNELSIIDKKALFALNMILISAANISMLSYTKPHFVIHYYDLITFSIISTLYLVLSLSSIVLTKLYYSYFEIKQIEQKELDTKKLEQIGQGKYATVYKAYVSSLDTLYAVKKLESKDVSDIERFKAEFNIMKALEHQNLLRVYSFDELKYEYVMDYCEYNLETYVSNNSITKESKRDLTLQLLNSFDYLHHHNIMHRDISPTNIMLKENEETKELTLKVMDFGIAKNNNELKKTRTYTRIRGTLIDPALEDFSRYNEQNDIYGLGLLINYINYRTDSVIQDGSDVSKIVNKCMDLNLTSRYHHVDEIIKDYMEASI